jgi:hypothetical protein
MLREVEAKAARAMRAMLGMKKTRYRRIASGL